MNSLTFLGLGDLEREGEKRRSGEGRGWKRQGRERKGKEVRGGERRGWEEMRSDYYRHSLEAISSKIPRNIYKNRKLIFNFSLLHICSTNYICSLNLCKI